MIENIIFDLGNVLISYDPKSFISKYVKEENQEKFFEIVFGSKEWQDLDRGTLEYDKVIEIFSEKFPEERKSIERLFNNNIQDVLFPIEKNLELLSQLKKSYKLYILSNFHKEAFLEISKRCNFDKYFDGRVISYEVKLLKPEAEIYQEILSKYKLVPENTLFVDDTFVNIEGARKFKINTIHLKEKEILKDVLLEKNIKL